MAWSYGQQIKDEINDVFGGDAKAFAKAYLSGNTEEGVSRSINDIKHDLQEAGFDPSIADFDKQKQQKLDRLKKWNHVPSTYAEVTSPAHKARETQETQDTLRLNDRGEELIMKGVPMNEVLKDKSNILPGQENGFDPDAYQRSRDAKNPQKEKIANKARDPEKQREMYNETMDAMRGNR